MALALAACGDGAEPAAAPAVSAEPVVTATPEATEPPAVVAPVLPEAAKEPTPEGASAFVRYYFETVNHAYQTGDVDELATIAADSCAACAGIADEIRGGYSSGGHISGGQLKINEVVVTPGDPALGLDVAILVDQAASQFVNSGGKVHQRVPSEENLLVGMVLVRDNEWRVAEWGAG